MGYGLDKDLKATLDLTTQKEAKRWKVFADTYEAYLGVLWLAARRKEIDSDTLDIYCRSLLESEAFPGMQERFQTWMDDRAAKRKRCDSTDGRSVRRTQARRPPAAA